MPEGLQYVLSGKLSENSRISVIGYDAGPSLIVEKCIQEIVTNCLDSSEGSKVHLHLILFSNDVTNVRVPSHRITSDVTTYDYIRNPCESLESMYEVISKNIAARPGRSHVMLIDDYGLFSVMCGCRDTKRQHHFMRLMNKCFRKIYLLFYKESLSKEEIGMIYGISSDIAFLQLHPDSFGSACNSNSKFICDLLKIREDRRVTHDKSVFQVTEDEIKEELIFDSSEKGGSSSSDVLKNLTTFKLTLEDDEKESKNKLHLPYFEAQKTSLEDPENFDDYDEEDEEDEEI